MYHEESNTPAKVRSSNLNDELGKVLIFILLFIYSYFNVKIKTAIISKYQEA